jgi:integrase
VAPLDVELWARRLGLDYPLALLLRALRTDRYLGTALHYLHREIPRSLMLCWAPEVDFFEDLVALADAYATSESMQKRYRHLRIDTPTRQQMDVGGMAKHPFAAVVARRISTTQPENDVWLETLRTWWVLAFLEAESRGVELSEARTEVGQSIRLCVHDTTGYGPWTPVMMDLKGDAGSYRGLHAHLVGKGQKLWDAQTKEDAHTKFLRSLAKIDLAGFADKNVLARSAPQSHAISPLLPAPAAAATPVHKPRQVNPHWLEDLDGESEDGDTKPVLHHLDGSPEDFECVESDETKSQSEQALHAKGVQLLSIEEQQRLPYSWSKPNPHERKLLQQWWRNTWRNSAHPDHDLAVLTYLAAQTSMSVRLVLQLGIGTESAINWQWDPQRQVLHRLPPRRYRSAVPDAQALTHLTPLAEKLVIQPSAAVREFLGSCTRAAPEATSLGQWFGPVKELEKRLRIALKVVAPRVTPAMFGGWLAQEVFEESQDPVLTHLLSSNSRSGLPGSCAYAAYNRPSVNLLTRIGAGAALTVSPTTSDTKLNCAGSAFQLDDEWIKGRLQQLLENNNTLAQNSAQWLEHHNALVTYLVVVLLCTSGARPVTSPFQSPTDFNLDDGTLYVEDKVSSHMHAGRLIPIDRSVARMIRDQYLAHLKSVAVIVGHFDPSLGAEIALLAQAKDSTQIPFLFYLRRSEDAIRYAEVSESALENLGGFTLEMQINVLRHRQSTWLKGKVRPDANDVDHEVINGLLGHAESGTATWGPFSPRNWQTDSEAVRSRLKESVKALAITKPALLIAAPQLSSASPSKSPPLRLGDASFGRKARAARTQRANDIARTRAREDIENFVKENNGVEALDAQAIDRIEQLMLRRESKLPGEQSHTLPHPRAALRYEVYCDWLQSIRRDQDYVVLVKRRYLPRLEEASPFSAEAPQARLVFDRLQKWHSTREPSLIVKDLDARGSLAVAVIGVIIESRVANMSVVRSLLLNQDYRLVRLDGRWHLEHAKYLDKYPTAPCTRYAISENTAKYFLQVLGHDKKEQLSGRAVRDEHLPLARLLDLDRTKLKYDALCQRLCEIVQQVNWQQLPGFCAGYLDGTLVSVALEHSSWYRLHKRAALGAPISYGMAEDESSVESQEDKDDRLISVDNEDEDPTTAQPEEAQLPIAHNDRFAPALTTSPSTTPGTDSEESKASGYKLALVDADVDAARTSSATPIEFTMQYTAVALMQAVSKAIGQAMKRPTNARRNLTVDLQEAIKTHSDSSVTCRMFVEWIHSLVKRKKGDHQLEISSISRYFVALRACFEQIAYNHDLTKCEEEEVTELYVKIMEARRELKEDMADAPAKKKRSKRGKSHDGSMDRYRTWRLALNLLRKFHRYACRRYGVEEADWSEIGGNEETLSISPRLVTEREYLHALKSLVGSPPVATLEETQAGFLLLLSYRFGLRAAEATNLTTADWVSIPDESSLAGSRKSRLVLVRSNKYRILKTDNARRQVPLLFELTELECQAIDRHMDLLLGREDHGDNAPLFPLVFGRERLSANMQLRAMVTDQLKHSCSDSNVSTHAARHSFAMLVLVMLHDETSLLQRGLFSKPPSSEWIDHVRRTVLCHPKTTRRSLWALARLMGHAHPRTTMRSYVHIIPEMTCHHIRLPQPALQSPLSPPWPARGVVDLDAIHPAPSYLAPIKSSPTRPDQKTPTSAKALRALTMLAKGLSVAQIEKSCGLTLAHAKDLAWLESEAIKAYDTQIRTGSAKVGRRSLARRIKSEKYKRFLASADSVGFDSRAWDVSLIKDDLQPSTLIGPSRQLVLFREEQFKFLNGLLRQWGIQRDHIKVVASPKLYCDVQAWAEAAGLHPMPADPPKPRQIEVDGKETKKSENPKQYYQLDTVLTGSPKTRVIHRCIVVPRENANALVQTSYELILLAVVHLFMLRAHRPTMPADSSAESANQRETS